MPLIRSMFNLPQHLHDAIVREAEERTALGPEKVSHSQVVREALEEYFQNQRAARTIDAQIKSGYTTESRP